MVTARGEGTPGGARRQSDDASHQLTRESGHESSAVAAASAAAPAAVAVGVTSPVRLVPLDPLLHVALHPFVLHQFVRVLVKGVHLGRGDSELLTLAPSRSRRRRLLKVRTEYPDELAEVNGQLELEIVRRRLLGFGAARARLALLRCCPVLLGRVVQPGSSEGGESLELGGRRPGHFFGLTTRRIRW